MDVFTCGGDECPKGGKHSWDGEGIIFMRPCPSCDNPCPGDCDRCQNAREIPSGGSATCSKCGLDAMTHSMMNAP